MRLSEGLRHLAKRIAARSGLVRLAARTRRGAVVLSYHNVIRGTPRGEVSLHVPVAAFRDQLQRLAQRYHLIPLRELLARHAAGRSVDGCACVTFDDAYRGVVDNAVPVLRELGVPATVFVVVGAAGRAHPFWWDSMADATGAIDGRDRLLEDLAGDEELIGAAIGPPPAVPWSGEYLPASWELLTGADMIELGLHTLSHPNLTRVTPARREAEIAGAWQVLRERVASAVPALAYPYGAWDATVAATAAASGLAGFTLGGRRLEVADPRVELPRVFVGPRMTADALEIACLGLGGFRGHRRG